MVCQKDQLCFEPLVSEPFDLKNKYNQAKQHQWPQLSLILEHQGEFDNKNNKTSNNLDYANNNSGVGSWSLLESLSNKNEHVNHDKIVYVHPLVKNYSFTLSLKSLEMCTESLGSETGSDISESGDEFSLPLPPKTNDEYCQIRRLKKNTRIVSDKPNFPPPLTSITGSENVQLTPSREGGRLVIKAATVSSNNSYFQTERVDGRLRLFLAEDYSPTSNDFDIHGEFEQQQEEEEDEDIEGNMRNMERPMPRKCKENLHEHKGLPNWKSCGVAIS